MKRSGRCPHLQNVRPGEIAPAWNLSWSPRRAPSWILLLSKKHAFGTTLGPYAVLRQRRTQLAMGKGEPPIAAGIGRKVSNEKTDSRPS